MSTLQTVIDLIVGLFGIGLIVGAFGFTIFRIVKRIHQRKKSIKIGEELYRKNAGIALVKNGQAMVFERSDIPGAWQFPQGGIEDGEEPMTAAYRELLEETGIDESAVSLLGEYPEWLTYKLPDRLRKAPYIGQTQRWFIFELTGDESVINLKYDDHQEFSNYKWIPVDQLEREAVVFRKPTYKKLASYIASLRE